MLPGPLKAPPRPAASAPIAFPSDLTPTFRGHVALIPWLLSLLRGRPAKHGTSWSSHCKPRRLDMPGRLRRGNYPVWRAILLSILSQAHPPVRDCTRHCTRYRTPGPALCPWGAQLVLVQKSRLQYGHATACCSAQGNTSCAPTSSTGKLEPLRSFGHLQSRASQPMPWPLQCTHERAELAVDLFSGRGSTCKGAPVSFRLVAEPRGSSAPGPSQVNSSRLRRNPSTQTLRNHHWRSGVEKAGC